jgi:hypothetical protein
MSDVDTERFYWLAQRYDGEAAVCCEMAEATVGPRKEVWLRIAAKWVRLAEEAQARSRPN